MGECISTYRIHPSIGCRRRHSYRTVQTAEGCFTRPGFSSYPGWVYSWKAVAQTFLKHYSVPPIRLTFFNFVISFFLCIVQYFTACTLLPFNLWAPVLLNLNPTLLDLLSTGNPRNNWEWTLHVLSVCLMIVKMIHAVHSVRCNHHRFGFRIPG